MPTSSSWRVLAAASSIFLGGCRQDMHNQPKYKPLRESAFFSDSRASRPLIAGTVARGDLREAADFYTGKAADGTTDLDYFPIAITKATIERGHQRFDVFCSPCHGRLGNGLGMIVRRGMKQPPSYHIDRLRESPPGHFFDVITNGYGAMYNYAAQIGTRDRWAIIAYIRALQYSQNVSVDTLTADIRAKLPAPGAPAGPEGGVDMPLVPQNPDRLDSPNSSPLPAGAPPSPLSPTPPQGGGAGKQ